MMAQSQMRYVLLICAIMTVSVGVCGVYVCMYVCEEKGRYELCYVMFVRMCEKESGNEVTCFHRSVLPFFPPPHLPLRSPSWSLFSDSLRRPTRCSGLLGPP